MRLDNYEAIDEKKAWEEQPPLNVTLNFAGFWLRFWATILDSIVLLAVSYLLFDPLRKIFGVEKDLYSFVDLLETIAGFVYYIVLTVKYGQTLGKMAAGIQVIHQEGEALTWGKVTYREIVGKIVSCLVLFIGYLAVAFDPKKRAWHDRMAKTYVVKRKSQKGASV